MIQITDDLSTDTQYLKLLATGVPAGYKTKRLSVTFTGTGATAQYDAVGTLAEIANWASANGHQNHFRFIQGQSVAYSTDMIRNITARNSFIDCVVYDTHHADNFQYLYHISDKDGTINVLPHGILIMAQGLATTAYTSSNIYDPGTNPAILLPGYPAVGD